MCTRDDFGIVTIMGTYQNDNVGRAQVNVTISLVGWDGATAGRASISVVGLDEFETRQFLGHSRWDGNFRTCHAAIGD